MEIIRERVQPPRLRRGDHAEHVQPQAVGDERARDQVQGEHVLLRHRGAGVWAQADELPGPLHHVRPPQALVPRAADALRRLWRPPPQRALRRAHGADARPPLPAGRRPHLLHGRADQGGGGGRARLHRHRLQVLWHDLRAQALDAARERARRPRDVEQGGGVHDRRAQRVQAEDGPPLVAQPGRRRLLRAEDRRAGLRRAQPALPVRHLPARLRAAGALRPQVPGARQRGGRRGRRPGRRASSSSGR